MAVEKDQAREPREAGKSLPGQEARCVRFDGARAPPPDKNTKPSTTKCLSVESLAGYGRARDWALDLKADLELWKQGGLAWSEMSTKLLLSGPPGTGKTTFARALCNTIQVPLLATSLSTMLEPGYLGDVLKQMSAAFEFAVNKRRLFCSSTKSTTLANARTGAVGTTSIGIHLSIGCSSFLMVLPKLKASSSSLQQIFLSGLTRRCCARGVLKPTSIFRCRT